MSKPNLYAIGVKGGRTRIFSVSQIVQEADIPKRAARRLIKRAVKAGDVLQLRSRRQRINATPPPVERRIE
jgi:hypothetical protein